MSIYDTLNEQQKKGVFATEGPVLLLAGAGSGKTRVLTHRIAYLIGELGVSPWNIMAITFTNKAAGEMKERVEKIVGNGGDSVWVTTFHSTCVRMLRRYADRLGYDNSFSIYDTDDQKSVMKDICKCLQIDAKMLKERSILAAISSAKDELVSPEEYERNAAGDFRKQKIAQAYKEYQSALRKNNAMDFDDLIVKTVELFKTDREALGSYQKRFKYIMVDEYQDTNTAQFELIRLLADAHHNLCVVGDDDQSIYKFRGANIRNILDFEKVYPEATVIRLEQNYRSTQNVLDAANAVIRNNKGRKAKTLWTDHGAGSSIHFRKFDNAYDEAEFIAHDVERKKKNGTVDYCGCAVLFRTNGQARILEEKFVLEGIPYNVVGGTNFYARREIKDLLAYLKTIDNGRDDLSVRRIINIPRRGIGAATIAKVQDYADMHEISFYDALRQAEDIPSLGKSAVKLKPFVTLIQAFRSKLEYYGLEELIKDVIETTGYVEELEASDEEDAKSRIENIDELISKAVAFETGHNSPTLGEFLEEVALVADIDNVEAGSNKVLLMTLHSAKGLEFPHVYMAGMEDGIFPSYMAIISDDPNDIEEERRLAYVGITRAMDDLTLCYARSRMVRGETQMNAVSRFVEEIPEELMDGGQPAARHSFTEEEEAEGGSRKGRRAAAYKPAAVLKPKRTAAENKPFIAGGGLGSLKAAGISRGAGAVAGGKPDYDIGNRVKHVKYGEGTVTGLEPGPRDYKVTVDFDGAGQKIMYAAFAKLEKV